MDSTELVTLATQSISDPSDLYVLIDFLNRTLKEKGLVFGLSKEESELQVTVYEERER